MKDALATSMSTLPEQLRRSLTWDRGKELSAHTQEVQAVARALNSRPRKILDWRTPAEAFDEHLRSLQVAGGATIP